MEFWNVDRYAFSLSIPHFMKCTQLQQWSAFIFSNRRVVPYRIRLKTQDLMHYYLQTLFHGIKIRMT